MSASASRTQHAGTDDYLASANLALNLTRSATAHPDRVALRANGHMLTYADLDSAATRVASLLQSRGVEPGDRVGMMVPNVAEFYSAYYGILRAGAVVVPMNTMLKSREIAYYLQDADAKVLLVWHELVEEAMAVTPTGADAIVLGRDDCGVELASTISGPAPVARRGDDTAVLLYTSGTTGQPKGAELTHANLGANSEVVADDLFRLTDDDVVLATLPLFHSFGQVCAMNAPVLRGVSISLVERFDAERVLDQMATDNVTIFPGVPTMYMALIAAARARDTSSLSLRLCMSGGASMPVEVLHAAESRFGCAVLEGYGLSETSPAASFNHPGMPAKPGSVGTPIRGVEMRVVDENDVEVPAGELGEVVIRGHNVMKGYWNRPEATAEAIRAGWFHTGDIGRVDEDGYFYIVDRQKDMVIRGGYNVYPREIEEVLYEHPAVSEVAVIGVPDPRLGEEVAAVVVLKPDVTATAAELREFVRGQVAAYKYPRLVWTVEQLPKGSTGKILKREIVIPAATDADES